MSDRRDENARALAEGQAMRRTGKTARELRASGWEPALRPAIRWGTVQASRIRELGTFSARVLLDDTLRAHAEELLPGEGPACGHSACSQHYIDTGSRECVRTEADELVGIERAAILAEGERQAAKLHSGELPRRMLEAVAVLGDELAGLPSDLAQSLFGAMDEWNLYESGEQDPRFGRIAAALAELRLVAQGRAR